MIVRLISAGALFLLSASVWAVSPYIKGNTVAAGNVQAVASAVETKLKGSGFKVVGKYFPKTLAGYGVVIATDDAMLDDDLAIARYNLGRFHLALDMDRSLSLDHESGFHIAMHQNIAAVLDISRAEIDVVLNIEEFDDIDRASLLTDYTRL